MITDGIITEMYDRIIKEYATNGIHVDDMEIHGGNGSHYTEFDIHYGKQTTTIQIGHDQYDNLITVGSYEHGTNNEVDYNQMSIDSFTSVEAAMNHINGTVKRMTS